MRAAILAVAVALVIVWAGMKGLDAVVRHRMTDMLINPSAVKDQGVWLQQEAFSRPEMLEVYGSSELTQPQGNRAEAFFRGKPTGFEVCPVGAPGHTTLLMAAKIGAVGEKARGKKVVIILSHSWFRRAGPVPEQVAGCLSPLQAYQYVRNPLLSRELKQRFASRLLEYPGALESHALLEVYLKGCAGTTGWNSLLEPLARACETGLSWEDHLAVGCAALLDPQGKPAAQTVAMTANHRVDWRAMIDPLEKVDSEAEAEEPEPAKVHSKQSPEEREEEFIKSYEGGKEWDDLRLLLDTLQALDMKPLLIGLPLGGNGLESHGITRADRDHFYLQLRKVCAPYGWPLLDLSEHDMDPGFLMKGTSHFTAKGWLYVNWVLDDFYHDRPIQGAVVFRGNEVRS